MDIDKVKKIYQLFDPAMAFGAKAVVVRLVESTVDNDGDAFRIERFSSTTLAAFALEALDGSACLFRDDSALTGGAPWTRYSCIPRGWRYEEMKP